MKGQIIVLNRALRERKHKLINSENQGLEAKHRGLQYGSQNQPFTQWTNNQWPNVTRLGPGFTRTLTSPPLLPASHEKCPCSLSTTGTVFLEWVWAEEAQSHLPVVKWMTIHSPQRLVMSVRSMATPNGAGNGEAQTKQMPPTSR